MIKKILERFNTKWIPVPESGCWLWEGFVMPSCGYGQFAYHGRMKLAHRISWILNRGNIPDGLNVLHKCDTRCCVNPDHLFLGTQQDNMDDMRAKGRLLVGAERYGSKVTEKDVREIRKSKENRNVLARKYGITPQTASEIRRGIAWKHVKQTKT